MSPVNPRNGKLRGFGRAGDTCWLSVIVPASDTGEEETVFVRLTEWQRSYLFHKLGTHIVATETKSFRLLRCDQADEPGHDCCREECFKTEAEQVEGNV